MSNTPNRLYHYTSFGAFVHIFDYQQENFTKNNWINVRLGNPMNMNDKNEITFFEKSFFTGSNISNEIKEFYTEMKEKSPHPYIFSLIHHIGNKWYPKDEIPMWFMYGDNGKGVRIAFDFKMVEEFCEKNHYLLKRCQYVNQNEMQDIARGHRNIVKKLDKNHWNTKLEDIYIGSLCYKTKDWEYEQEYRIVAFGNHNEKYDAYSEEEQYLHIPLPLKAVKEITVGPLADELLVKRCIELIRNELFAILPDLKPFDIKKTKLQIR
ncbi:DUF2971 domain-containing protein [Prevotella sp. Rep29]|uniref:DUF2971 domain-containing protein n=1 Tax=Prevotella sp. Rep29 TaxID=2691580 RepID=UPI001C6EC2E7|nr:DUF2971 domain-containing protein [Prevotella sp. Rep29]QYR10355.1 DUF2971 domain-containing protein [Prevotella sp. Rep29]